MTEPSLFQTVPRDFESLRGLMIERKASLPKRLAQIAAFCLANPEDIAFGTAASIAASANVQPSTLVRLAQHFGYDGFSEFQGIFRDRLRERTLSYEERLASLERERDHIEEAELLAGFINAATQSIAKMANSLDPAEFAAAIGVLAPAETIYLVARRRAYPLAAHMAYALGKLQIRNQIVASPNGTDAEIIELAGPRDCAIITSFAPYSAESIRAAERFSVRGVPVIGITDSVLSPLVALSRHCFEVAETDFAGFRSISASMTLAMALPVAIAEARRQPARNKNGSTTK